MLYVDMQKLTGHAVSYSYIFCNSLQIRWRVCDLAGTIMFRQLCYCFYFIFVDCCCSWCHWCVLPWNQRWGTEQLVFNVKSLFIAALYSQVIRLTKHILFNTEAIFDELNKSMDLFESDDEFENFVSSLPESVMDGSQPLPVGVQLLPHQYLVLFVIRWLICNVSLVEDDNRVWTLQN